uniref:Uncharacterized protein n=1 Tax=Lactuca sativa TaxID=4236 RepID=A0A9R1UYE5_LACSA|nr:hypothetical protein LSAT_V11C700356820 [Lactuca sativa]
MTILMTSWYCKHYCLRYKTWFVREAKVHTARRSIENGSTGIERRQMDIWYVIIFPLIVYMIYRNLNNVFILVEIDLERNYEFFQLRWDVRGKRGFTTIQKCTTVGGCRGQQN